MWLVAHWSLIITWLAPVTQPSVSLSASTAREGEFGYNSLELSAQYYNSPISYIQCYRYYCLAQTYEPVECGAGFYSDDGQYQCEPCWIGSVDFQISVHSYLLTEKSIMLG